MDRFRLALVLSSAALLVALGAWALDQRASCDPASGCMDERGPVHPTFGLWAAVAAWVPTLAGVLLRRRLHGAWTAALSFWPTILLAWPAAAVLEYATRGPTPVEAWAFPVMAALDAAAFVSLAAARRQPG